MKEQKTTILVIDDEPINFDVIEFVLSQTGVDLYYRSTGFNIIDTLEQTRADLLLLDVLMPGVDGVEVCKTIRSDPNWQTLPVIMVTALSDKNDLARCLNAGADDFLSKPINSQELKARTKALLRIHTQYQEIGHLIQTQRNTISLLRNTLRSARRSQNPLLDESFNSHVSHELNTPLNGILGPVRLLLDEHVDLPTDEARGFLVDVEISATHLHQNIRRLLTYLELESNPLETPQRSAPRHSQIAQELVTDSVKQLPYPREHKEKAQICIDEQDLEMDLYELEIVLSELLDNAFLYSTDQSEVRIVGSRIPHGYEIKLTYQGDSQIFRDIFTGVGPLDQIKTDPFHNGAHGLGLYNAKRILMRMGVNTELGFDPATQLTTIALILPVYMV